MSDAVTNWIEHHAHRLTEFDPAAPLTDLKPLRAMIGGAKVVALGSSIRTSHELAAVSHRILRLLAEFSGFRSLAFEGDDPHELGLDEYISTGTGDARALLSVARTFWQLEEVADLVEWMREHHRQHPDDAIRFARDLRRIPDSAPGPQDLAAIERDLADNITWWLEESTTKIVYWGGIAHTAVGDPRAVSPAPEPIEHRNAGAYLRERLGPDYVSIGLTFHHGLAPFEIPPPPEGFADHVLGEVAMDAYLLDLRQKCPPSVESWLRSPTRTRLIGPAFDPGDNESFHMSGGSLKDWFDILIHVNEISPAQPLD